MDLLQSRAMGLFSAALREGLADRTEAYGRALEHAREITAELTPVVEVDLAAFSERLEGLGVDGPTRAPVLLYLAQGFERLGLAVRLPEDVSALPAAVRDDVLREFSTRVVAYGGEDISVRRRFDHTPVVDLKSLPADGGGPRTATLLVIAGRQLGMLFKLREGATVLGRGDESDIRIEDDGVSRRHATIHVSGSEVVVEDAGSRNGLVVNGEVIERKPLEDGDRLRIGATTILKFSFQDELEEQFQSELYRSVTLDPLTGVPNRKVVLDRLRSECAYAARVGQPVAALLLDLDHFKAINDGHGHLAGDLVLKSAAQVVQRALRSEDIVGRYGGEEFLVVLRGTDQRRAYVVGERIRKLVEEHEVVHGGARIPVTVSIGIAAWVPRNAEEASRLVDAADQQLYRAKESGRNRCAPSP